MVEIHPTLTARRKYLSPFIGPVARLVVAAVLVAPAVPVLAAVLVGLAPAALGLAAAGFMGGAALAAAQMRRGYPHEDLGLCNIVTLLRLALAASLLAPLVNVAVPWSVLAVALGALLLDGADGWLARREARTSAFGARFDMEVDAALGLILALNAYAAGPAGPAVLLLGLPRYAFMVAGWVWPWMAAPLPERAGRKTVCVLQITALIALQVPLLGNAQALAVVVAAITALVWSFGRDTLWLWRTRT